MALNKVAIENFTAFKRLDLAFNPGVNVLIGDNGTGKTHLMKLLYSACSITQASKGGERKFDDKLARVFYPLNLELNRLVHRKRGVQTCKVSIHHDSAQLAIQFTSKKSYPPKITGEKKWHDKHILCSYIPVKEMLANAPGFLALYESRVIRFEEIYRDIIALASLPPLTSIEGPVRENLEKILEDAIQGEVVQEQSTGEFFLKNRQGNLEFALLSEGMRKLGLLLLLIRNGYLAKGSILFWDEPEANLNPRRMVCVVKIILKLAEMGMQVFLATHNNFILNEIDLEARDENAISYHAFFRNKGGDVEVETRNSLDAINENCINQAFGEQYDRLYRVDSDDD